MELMYFMPDHPLLMRFCLNKVYIIQALYLYTGIRKKTQIYDCISNQREQRRNRNRMGRHEFKTQERMNTLLISVNFCRVEVEDLRFDSP